MSRAALGNVASPPLPVQPEQEPVKVGRMADRIKGAVMRQEVMLYTDDYLPVGTAIYTTPPQRQPLTEEAILLLLKNCPKEDPEVIGWVTRQKITWMRAIEAAHNIGAKP